ncbi:MAG: hypothetical protein A2X30_01570 [Elusimicrobia bacterium GWB2_63_16]|nr:MAG: hypothetical protein A2X30_01570 [Elusimicrobia bacterium GWB2_63_16]
MNDKHIMKSLNMTGAEALTLEKAADRMEFEALPLLLEAKADDCNGINSGCTCNTAYTVCTPNNPK